MLYIIFGTENYLLNFTYKAYVKNILNNFIDDLNFLKVEYNEISYDDLILNISLLPFGCDKKVIVCKNAGNLLKEKDISDFVKIINSNDEYVDVILTINEAKSKIKFDKLENIKNKKLIEINEIKEEDWVKYIKGRFSKEAKTISDEAAFELKKRCNGDFEKLTHELEKLFLYKDNIEVEDINIMVNELLEDNSFNLKNYLLDNKKEEALKLYNDLRIKNLEPVVLVAALVSQFIFLKEVEYLYRVERKNNNEIANDLGLKSAGRIYYATKDLVKCKTIDLDKVLNDLYNLDMQLKTSSVNKDLAMQLFILNFGGKTNDLSNM